VLDVTMPHLDGLEVCKRLRATSSVPIIMLTAKTEEIDKVVGLELGADDYITKPFSIREFRSRVKAALRRSSMGAAASDGRDGATEPLHAGDLAIDFDKRTVRLREELVRTTFVEFEILGQLARSPGRVFSREALLDRIWGDSAYRDPRTIDVHIRHLREKLEADAKEPDYIFTVRGVGYRFRDRDAER
jgi:two-component system, OmpR family, response regulator